MQFTKPQKKMKRFLFHLNVERTPHKFFYFIFRHKRKTDFAHMFLTKGNKIKNGEEFKKKDIGNVLRRSVFSWRQYVEVQAIPWLKKKLSAERRVNKTFTFQCCYPCCEYLRMLLKKSEYMFIRLFRIVSMHTFTILNFACC